MGIYCVYTVKTEWNYDYFYGKGIIYAKIKDSKICNGFAVPVFYDRLVLVPVVKIF